MAAALTMVVHDLSDAQTETFFDVFVTNVDISLLIPNVLLLLCWLSQERKRCTSRNAAAVAEKCCACFFHFYCDLCSALAYLFFFILIASVMVVAILPAVTFVNC